MSFDMYESDRDHLYVLYGCLDCCVDVVVVCGCGSQMYRFHLEEFVDSVEDSLIVAVDGEPGLGLIRVGVLCEVVSQEAKCGQDAERF